MDKRCLIMKWDYEYDKEGTWFDEDSGEERYELNVGAVYTLPHIDSKSLEVRSVTKSSDVIKAQLYVDHKIYSVYSDGEPVVAHAFDDYMVAGDSVSQSLKLIFSIQ